jgi:hypothetical protein
MIEMKKFYGLCLVLLMLFGSFSSCSAFRFDDSSSFRTNLNSDLNSDLTSNLHSNVISVVTSDVLDKEFNLDGFYDLINISKPVPTFNSNLKSTIFDSVSDDVTPVVTNQTNKWTYNDDFIRITPDNLNVYKNHTDMFVNPITDAEGHYQFISVNGKSPIMNNVTDVESVYAATAADPTDIAVEGVSGDINHLIYSHPLFNQDEFEAYVNNASNEQPTFGWMMMNSTIYWHKYHTYINMNPRIVAVLEAPPHENHPGSTSESSFTDTKGYSTSHSNGWSTSNGWSITAGGADVLCGSGTVYSKGWADTTTNSAESVETESSTLAYTGSTTNVSTVIIAFDRYEYDYYNHKNRFTHVNGTDFLKQRSLGVSYETVSLDEFNKNNEYYALPKVTDITSTAGNLSTYDSLDPNKPQYTADAAGQSNTETLTWQFDHKQSETDVVTHSSTFSANFQVGAVVGGLGGYGFCSITTSQAWGQSETYTTNNFQSSTFKAMVRAYPGGEKITWNANFYENPTYHYLVVKYGLKESGTYYT